MAAKIVRSDFDTVYRAHFTDVRQFVFQFVQDAGLAEELTQDVFLRALDAWDGYRGDAPEQVWLLRIARNICLDHLRSPRSRKRAPYSLEVAESEGRAVNVQMITTIGSEPPVSVEQVALRAEMTECVQQFVLSLPETLRTPLILHDMQGLTNIEIARVVGCSLEAAKMRLHRAREKLRQMMDERCDLFHDERNVLSCLPVLPEAGFVALDEIADLPRS